MRALAVISRDTGPAVADVPDRDPGPGEVRVKVAAASVNGFDMAVASGRLWDHLPHAFPVTIGRDFAGTVAGAGPGVSGFAAGDRVAGVNTVLELGPGPIAEYFTVPAAGLARVPDAVTSVQAAAAGLAGVTALDLIAALGLDAGETVLVSGATGGVGAFAVQLAVARGARVIATARPGQATGFARSLGAHAVADYTGDIGAAVREIAPEGVVKIAHAAGDPAALAALLTPGGTLASVLGGTEADRDDVTMTSVMASYTPAKLTGLLAQIADGKLTVPVAASYPLEKATDALDGFGAGKLGKIVVTA